MGLRNACVMFLLVLGGCMAKKDAIKKADKYWFECCDPGIPAAQKDMCKWLDERKGNTLIARDGTDLTAVWTGCEEGKEPWRKWE
jgi:hypothetical protein